MLNTRSMLWFRLRTRTQPMMMASRARNRMPPTTPAISGTGMHAEESSETVTEKELGPGAGVTLTTSQDWRPGTATCTSENDPLMDCAEVTTGITSGEPGGGLAERLTTKTPASPTVPVALTSAPSVIVVVLMGANTTLPMIRIDSVTVRGGVDAEMLGEELGRAVGL